MEFLLDGIRAVTPQQCVMYVVGALLIYLAIKKDYEPSLLLPMGFGAILVNLPMSGVLNQMVAGVMFAKLLNLFCKNKVNPMVGAAGISAFPMSARVIQKMGQEADCTNHLLMHAVGANVAGQIASVLAGGMILNLVPQLLK